jgi:uncharacterized protein YndB with AHSA1/START domain
MSDPRQARAAGSARPKLVVERTYRSTVAELWELWTTKEGFESWWGPEGCRVEVRRLEARAGGRLEYCMITEGSEHIATAKRIGLSAAQEVRAQFAEMRPQHRLAIVHVMDFVPGVEPYESTVAVDFIPLGESARMVVTIDTMHSDEFTRLSQEGFAYQLTKLDRRFGGGVT